MGGVAEHGRAKGVAALVAGRPVGQHVGVAEEPQVDQPSVGSVAGGSTACVQGRCWGTGHARRGRRRWGGCCCLLLWGTSQTAGQCTLAFGYLLLSVSRQARKSAVMVWLTSQEPGQQA